MFNFEYFNKLGLNLYTSSNVKNVFNWSECNVLKSPNISCKRFQHQKQDSNDIAFLKEQDSCGYGIILGYNNIYALDIDGYFDENIICNLLKILDLPVDYEWVIKSGSSIGFHIIFRCFETNEYKDKTTAFFARENNRDFGKIEFKFEGYSILPPSLHDTGNYYSFYNKIPQDIPKEVKFENLKTIEKYYCSYQTMLSNYGGLYGHEIKFIAPIDTDIDFIFEKKLRFNTFLIISEDTKEIRNIPYKDESLFLVQISLLMLDTNYNIVYRRLFNYIDNKNVLNKECDSISFSEANKLINYSKVETFRHIYRIIEISENIIMFNKESLEFIESEVEAMKYGINKEFFSSKISGRRQEHIKYITTEEVELNYFFSKKIRKKIDLNSVVLKSYAIYYLFLHENNIPFTSKDISKNELWEIRQVHEKTDDQLGIFIKNNIDYIKQYLSKEHGYRTGAILDFLEENTVAFPRGIGELIDLINKQKIKDMREAQERDYLRDDYDYGYRNRNLDRDVFDALTDGQYGDFDDFNGDFDNLRDSMGL